MVTVANNFTHDLALRMSVNEGNLGDVVEQTILNSILTGDSVF